MHASKLCKETNPSAMEELFESLSIGMSTEPDQIHELFSSFSIAIVEKGFSGRSKTQQVAQTLLLNIAKANLAQEVIQLLITSGLSSKNVKIRLYSIQTCILLLKLPNHRIDVRATFKDIECPVFRYRSKSTQRSAKLLRRGLRIVWPGTIRHVNQPQRSSTK